MAGVRSVWGDRIENLPQEGLRLMKEAGGVYVDGHKPQRCLPFAAIRSARLGIVSYPGSGKYQDAKFWYYDELPQNEVVLDAYLRASRTDPVASSGPPGRPPPAGRDWSRLGPPPAGEGWWPVVVVVYYEDG